MNWRRCGYAIGCAALVFAACFAAVTPPARVPADDFLSKRAAARLIKAEQDDDVIAALGALSATDLALQHTPESPDLRFFRARALELLGLGEAAAEAYVSYLGTARSPGKRAEARTRIRELRQPRPSSEQWRVELPLLRAAAMEGRRQDAIRIVSRFPQQARGWGEEECLAQWAYGIHSGRADFAARELGIAREIGLALVTISGESLLRDAVAAVDGAIQADDTRRIAILARAHQTYGSVSARLRPGGAKLFAQAAEDFVAGRSPMALAARAQYEAVEIPPRYRALQALIDCRKGGRLENSGDVEGARAAYASGIRIYEALREYDNVWQARTADARLLRERAAAWRARRGVLAAATATGNTWQLQSTLIDAARAAMQEQMWEGARSLLSLAEDTSAHSESTRAEVYLLRAVAQWFAGEKIQTSMRNLENARTLANLAASHYDDEYLALLLDVAESAILRETDRTRAAKLLASALTRVAEWNKEDGELALTAAADQLSTIYRGCTAVHSELVDMLDGWGRTAQAFAVGESGRGQVLHNRVGARLLTAAELQRSMPRGTVLVSFTALEDRLLVYAISNDQYLVVRSNITKAKLERLTKQFATDVAGGHDSHASASQLQQTLFGSIDLSQAKTIVVVADEILAQVPFSVLMNARMNVVLAPSGSMYAHLAKMPEAPRKTALVVGDPAFSVETFPRLSRLPAAAAEAKEIAALYEAKLLFDTHAGQDPFLRGIASSDVIHVASHVEDGVLILAGAELAPEDIAVTHVKRGSLVVLAACRTGGMRGDQYIGNLAIAFLAAGSRTAIATLWNVEDSATRRFSRRLHHHLTRGVPAAQAVRRVQLEMIAAGVPARTWGAFQVYGGG